MSILAAVTSVIHLEGKQDRRFLGRGTSEAQPAANPAQGQRALDEGHAAWTVEGLTIWLQMT